MAKKRGKKKVEHSAKHFAPAFMFTILIVGLGAVGFLFGGDGATTYLDATFADGFPLNAKIVRHGAQKVANALFDIKLDIPRQGKTLDPGEHLKLTVDLTNFGGPGNVDIDLNYIVVSSRGDIVFIEHERRGVNTQASFLKTLTLPELPSGSYGVYVEMLYSDTSAIAKEQFKIR